MPTEKQPSTGHTQLSLLQESPLLVDEQAKQECRNLLVTARIKRREKYSNHLAFIIISWIGIGLLIGILCCRFMHMILPAHHQWLTGEQVSKIDEFFIHGTVGGILVAFVKSRIMRENN